MSYITNNASFDSNDLTQVPGLTVLATNPYVPARRGLSLADIARTNTSKVNSAFYNKKAIAVRVGITRPTRDLVEQSFDILMSLIQGREKDLLLRQSGGTRRYTATYSDNVFRQEGGSYLELDLIFETSDHYGYDTTDTLLLQVSNYTSATKTDQLNVGGSAEWQVPVILLTLSAVNGASSKYIQIGNDGNGQQIKVTRTWAAGDVLEIDSFNQTVKVNGAPIAFTGDLPTWKVGVGYITYSDNFVSSRTISYSVKYKKRYV